MKKTLLIFFLIAFISFEGITQTQNQGDARVHLLGTYGFQSKNPGAGAGMEFFFADHFAIMPSYIFQFPQIGKSSNFNADLRYYVSEGPSQLYFMAGYSQYWENSQPNGAGVRQSFNGANLGVGAYIRLVDWMGLSTEFKFTSVARQELGFRVGLAFPL